MTIYIYIYIYICPRVQGSQGGGGAPPQWYLPTPLPPVAWTFNPYVNIQLFLMFFVYFFPIPIVGVFPVCH